MQTCCPPGQVYAEDQYWEPPACSEEGEETTVLLYTVLYSTVLLSTDDIFILLYFYSRWFYNRICIIAYLCNDLCMQASEECI